VANSEVGEESAQRIEHAISELKALRDGLDHFSKDGIDAVVTPDGAFLVSDAQASVTSSEARYRHIINRMSALVVELSPTGTIVYLNDAVTAITKFSHDKLIGRNWLDLLLPLQDSISLDVLRHEFLENGELEGFKTGLRNHDGSRKIFSWNSAHVRGTDGSIERIIYFGTDVTDLMRAKEELRIAAIAFESQEGIIVTDTSAVILRVNRAFTRLTGYSEEDALGKSPHLLSSGHHDKAFYQSMWATLLKEGYWQGEIWNRRKNGNVYAEWLTISPVFGPDGSLTHYVGTFSDISDNKEAEAEIHRLAYFDPLTKLPNRRLLQDRLEQALITASRSGLFGVFMFIDLDHFKILNDTRGHNAGDRLLVEVALRMRATVREGDTVARLGGDEFVVLLENVNELAVETAAIAKQIGEKLLEALSLPYNFDDFKYHCTASVGIKLFQGKDNIEELFKHADLAMYEAKTVGRNALRFYDPAMQATVTTRASIEYDLRSALEKNQFRLYFQPQLGHDCRIVGAEALIRWQHPTRGLVSPVEFIPVAESTGLILLVGLWVLETACALIKTWESHLYTRDLQLSVNVSARQFHQHDFVEQVLKVLQSSAINPDKLKLELTESLVLDDINETIAKMNELEQAGVCFSMDDFGTGYSSLSYLTQLPLDQLKIDQSFVRNINVTTNDAVIVQTIIGMAASLGINVIAEGVETESQRVFLEQNGCPLYQGYLFSPPVPIEEFEAFLKQAEHPK
jgi:diguanylate cyclase (GGDEF)-like protein/PAS domain S-box-containing protein